MNDNTKARLDELRITQRSSVQRIEYAVGLGCEAARDGNVDLVEMVQADIERSLTHIRDGFREQRDLAMRLAHSVRRRTSRRCRGRTGRGDA